MQLTKYEHACFTVKHNNQIVVVDPGGFTTDFIAPPLGVVAVIITHEHQDHFDHDQLAAIIDKNPDAIIIGHQSIVSQIEAFPTMAVASGDIVRVGGFTFEFLGGDHALIHQDIPLIPNLAVLINDLLYYPGDSFAHPERAIDTLLLPVAAPWLKVSEVMDYITTTAPRLIIPTHDAILSNAGQSLADRMLTPVAEKAGSSYQRINGESIEI